MQSDQQKPQPEGSQQPVRRTFLNRLWGLIAALACLEMGWLTGSLLQSRSKIAGQDTTKYLLDAGKSDSLSPGEVKAFPEGALYIACLDDGSFLALSRTCTHLGCSIPWDSNKGKFICPCHGSTFDITGTVLTAPAIRPLDYFPIRIENGLLRVDISKPVKRDGFSPSQTVRL